MLWIRTLLFAALAYLVFGWVCVPVKTGGAGMEPTYGPGRIAFCWRPSSWLGGPEHYDVVFVRIPGSRSMLLRRVVGLSDDVVEFQNGKLMINGEVISEPYVKRDCDWNMPAGRVEADSVFVVGDNRDLPMDEVMFGQIPVSGIVGSPLW